MAMGGEDKMNFEKQDLRRINYWKREKGLRLVKMRKNNLAV
jgi:hypothetical protein